MPCTAINRPPARLHFLRRGFGLAAVARSQPRRRGDRLHRANDLAEGFAEEMVYSCRRRSGDAGYGRRQTLRLRIPGREGSHPLSRRRQRQGTLEERVRGTVGERTCAGSPRRTFVAGRRRRQGGHIRSAGDAFLPRRQDGRPSLAEGEHGQSSRVFGRLIAACLWTGFAWSRSAETAAASVVAYDLADGKEKWKWASDGTKFASPMLLAVDGLKAVVVETASTISAISLADGKLLWSTPFSTQYNASTPMIEGSVLYYAGSGKPVTAVKLEKQGDKVKEKELWTDRDASVIFNTPVIKDGLMFGLSERNEIFCIDTKTGKKLWSHRLEGGGGRGRGGFGSIIAAGPVLFALTPAGELVVFKPDRAEFKQVASYKVASGNTYAYPVVTSAGVYIKDRDSVTYWTFQ